MRQTRASNRCGYIFSQDTCGEYRLLTLINTGNWGGLCTPQRDAPSSGNLEKTIINYRKVRYNKLSPSGSVLSLR